MSVARSERLIPPTTESLVTAEIRRFGFASPIPLLSPAECEALERHCARSDLPSPLDWPKGHAATDRTIYEIAARPQLLALLRPLLGEDIVLWGATIIRRGPGHKHAWHSDMESAAPDSRVVSAWLGVGNVNERSGMWFVAGSHLFGRSVQEVLAGLGEDRETLSDARMMEIARRLDPASELVQAGSRDGEVVLFDGRVWHASRNGSTGQRRTALLLQYAPADHPIAMPAAHGYEWPFRFLDSPRVPAILVSGTGGGTANRLVPPPPSGHTKGASMITTLARTIPLPLAEDPEKRWRAYPQFKGPTRTLAQMSCHISVLSPGHHPHPPHIHDEEELLVVLDGEVEIELADDRNGTGSRRHPLRPGMFSYYPVTQHHTIHNVGAERATYLMFKWHADSADAAEPLPASVFTYDTVSLPPEPKPKFQALLFQQTTRFLGRLHAHLTILQPGAGYEPHADAYDVAILLLSGEIETVGERVRPLGLVYYSAGELHGMRNVGDTPATYLVFEFHSPAGIALREQQKAEARRKKEEERRAQQAARQAQRAAAQALRKEEKRRRKRGLRGLIRKIGKAFRKLGR
jgi:uncharacterized cupin superfamily protein